MNTIREFETARLRIVVDALPEDDIDLSWDEDGSTREGLESGKYIAFCARARLFLGDVELARDYLGGCIYESLEDFAKPGQGYCADMIREVCCRARLALLDIKALDIRTSRVQS